MKPTLTTSGKALLATAGVFVLSGVIVRSWALVSIGGVAVILLLAAMVLFYPRTILLGHRQLEVAWWIPPAESAGGALRVDHPFSIQMFLRNRSPYHLGRAEVGILHAQPVYLDSPAPATLLPAQTEVELRVGAHCRSAGQWHLYGMTVRLVGPLGLYQVLAYYPLPLAMRVFPRMGGTRARLAQRPQTGTPHERTGRHPLRLRGLGGDLREIREHQHGDPFKHIAWKATARTRHLMVKEYDSEIVLTHLIVLDASWSMRAGHYGKTKLDHAIELAAAFARWATDAGDRVGLVTFDSRVLHFLRPSEGRPHLAQVVDRLMDLWGVVDEDLTDLTDGELVKAVADFVLYQEGLDVRVRQPPPRDSDLWPRLVADDRGTLYDRRALTEWVRSALEREAAHALRPARPVVASTEEGRLLRRYCRRQGIQLPFRSGDDLQGSKDRGFGEALRLAAASRSAQFILLLTDLEGITLDRSIQSRLALAARRHHPVVVVPHAPDFGPSPKGPAARRVAEILRQDDQLRADRLARAISRCGVSVLGTHPDDALLPLLRRLARVRRRHAGRA